MFRKQLSRAWAATLTIVCMAGFASAGPVVFDPGETVAGKTQAELSADWWKYVFSVPLAQNPLADQTGANALVGQSGPVVFLGGSFSISGVPAVFPSTINRSITINENKILFFPIVNTWIDNLGVDPPLTVEQLRASADQVISQVTGLHASVDGTDIPDLTSHRQMSPVFSYHIPDANLFSAFGFNFPAQDVDPAVADGYYLALHPLTVGQHTINFGGAIGESSTNATYQVNVQAAPPAAIPLPAAAVAGLITLSIAAGTTARLRRARTGSRA